MRRCAVPVHDVGGESGGEAQHVKADLSGGAEGQAGHDGKQGQVYPQSCSQVKDKLITCHQLSHLTNRLFVNFRQKLCKYLFIRFKYYHIVEIIKNRRVGKKKHLPIKKYSIPHGFVFKEKHLQEQWYFIL